MGIFLTAKHAIAYWNFSANATKEDRETFQTYDDLDSLFEDQDWLNKRWAAHIKAEAQNEYATLMGRPAVERLDI